MTQFTCPTCGNSFEKDAPLAVCNGINVVADYDSEPILDADGNLIIEKENAHAAVVMTKEGG